MKDKREVILEFHSSPDAILNALHQAGWQIIPREPPATDDRQGPLGNSGPVCNVHLIETEQRDTPKAAWIETSTECHLVGQIEQRDTSHLSQSATTIVSPYPEQCDRDLVWLCAQCGGHESAEYILDERKALVDALEKLRDECTPPTDKRELSQWTGKIFADAVKQICDDALTKVKP